ncbi:MAG: hypothetical protein C0183_05905 [Roseiflexus castenholzii]|nr:MAG: hypothetical protein C0183_05905 [Roseiflexus castenholzii]
MVDNKRRPARAMLAFFNSEHDSIWVQLFDLRSCTCMLLQSMLDRFYGWEFITRLLFGKCCATGDQRLDDAQGDNTLQ